MTDGVGGFALGSASLLRQRKYHGLFLGIPGRSEKLWLADLRVECNGLRLLGPDPEVENGAASEIQCGSFEPGTGESRWHWRLGEGGGRLTWLIRRGNSPGSIFWQWRLDGAVGEARLRIHPVFGFRPLHGLGGRRWSAHKSQSSGVLRFEPWDDSGGVSIRSSASLRWNPQDPGAVEAVYPIEAERGYEDRETLWAGGFWSVELSARGEREAAQEISLSEGFSEVLAEATVATKAATAARDFCLERPFGVVAGFPWFGEWGRDTFFSLCGLSAARAAAGEPVLQVVEWTWGVLDRWVQYLRTAGMIPNLLARQGEPQWDSCDGSLALVHALAGLWQLGLAPETGAFGEAARSFAADLDRIVEGIRADRHLHLKWDPGSGLVEVTSPHSSWMDARIAGNPVTPRTGFLPEINALWFQAHALQLCWKTPGKTDWSRLERLGRSCLEKSAERSRPNGVFLLSVPLSPAFVLKEGSEAQVSELMSQLSNHLFTPMGLRTLDPRAPGYRARYGGSQEDRDRSYHQGLVWPWLGAHYEMAADRFDLPGLRRGSLEPADLESMPIHGQLAEICEAEPPFGPRGAPAQAWSLACRHEWLARRELRLDERLREALRRREP